MILFTSAETPIGTMTLTSTERGISHAFFGTPDKIISNLRFAYNEGFTEGTNMHLLKLTGELEKYFKGELFHFTVALDPHGTPFQLRIWEILFGINYGETITYKRESEIAGNPLAIRAIAAANAKNPVSVVIPCHRVIGSDGKMTGYAGGVERKKWLLQHEQKYSGKGSYLRLFD
jgi:O-6-methylguanine DNA methyltransferase